MAKTKSELAAEAAPTISKMDAVRAALRDGVVMPQAGVAHIKERYGLDVAPNLFSAHKTKIMQELSQAGTPGPARPQPEPAGHAEPARPKAPGPAPEPAKAAARPAPAEAASPADLARQVKQLVARHGAGAVADMLDVFKD